MNEDELLYASASSLIPETFFTGEVLNNSEINRLHGVFEGYKRNYTRTYGRQFSYYEFFNDTGLMEKNHFVFVIFILCILGYCTFHRFVCEDMVKECWFGGSILANCCSSAKEIITDFGKCIQFRTLNLGPSEQTEQYIAGAQYGFTVLLDTKVDEMKGAFNW